MAQSESHQVPTNRIYENITSGSFNQIVENLENDTSTKRIPAGATRVLPPAVAPHPKSKVHTHR